MDVKRDNGTRWKIQTGAILLNFVISKPNITFCVYCYQWQCQKTSTNSKYCRKQEIWKKMPKSLFIYAWSQVKLGANISSLWKNLVKINLMKTETIEQQPRLLFFLNLFVCCFFFFFSAKPVLSVLHASVLGIIIHHWQKQTRSAWAINWSEKSDVPQLIVRTEKTRLVRYLLYLWVQTEGERLNLNGPHS